METQNRELEKLSENDPLTGIPNRRKFEAVLEEEWNRNQRAQTPLSVIMIDIDHFKPYNDTYGHQQGDICLRQTAQIIAAQVKRAGELAARYGGEEFIIILPDSDIVSARGLAKRILSAVWEASIPHKASPLSNRITVSIGVCSVVPGDAMDSGHPVRRADQALYRAKEEGRNRIIEEFPRTET